MCSVIRKSMVCFVLLVAIVALSAINAQAVNVSENGVALEGYDVVSYHVSNSAVKGSSEFATEWNGAQWHFASAENLALFNEDPELYAPQYGGYCAYAAANNAIAPIDPRAFSVVDEKLYLNYSLGVQRRWSRNKEENILVADSFWPQLKASLGGDDAAMDDSDPDIDDSTAE